MKQSIAHTIHAKWLAQNEVHPTVSYYRQFLRSLDLDYIRESQPTAFLHYFHFADGSVIKLHSFYDHGEPFPPKRVFFTEPFNSVADMFKAVFNVSDSTAITKSPLA